MYHKIRVIQTAVHLLVQQNGRLQAAAPVDPEPGLVGELVLLGRLLPAATAAWSAVAAADMVVVGIIVVVVVVVVFVVSVVVVAPAAAAACC